MTTIGIEELDALEKVALAAGDAAWEHASSDTFFGQADFVQLLGDAGTLGTGFFQVYGVPRDQAHGFAEHIATFDPPTILRLIAALRAKAGA